MEFNESVKSITFLTMNSLFFSPPAMGESEAAEETVSGGPEEGGCSTESSEAMVSSSPQGCVRHPAGRPQIPPSQTPEKGRTGHCQSSGTTVRGQFGTN